MSYRRALIGRWSRRERLAVAVLAMAVAFLVGTTILLVAASTGTTAIASEFTPAGSATFHDSPEAARRTAPSDAVVLPMARIRTADGQEAWVIARPSTNTTAARLVGTGEGTTLGTLDGPAERTLIGADTRQTLTVTPRGNRGGFPPWWYVADRETVRQLGPTGALVVSPGAGTDATGPEEGVPLQGALAFFLLGSQEAVTLLGVVATGAGLLVAVVVWSIIRMTVRDRMLTVRVARATGATPGAILATFTARATLVTGAGLAAGYCLGVIAVNVAVNIAIFLGVPVALPLTVTNRTVRLLVPLLGGLGLTGVVGGAIAAWPVVRRQPRALAVGVSGNPRHHSGRQGGLNWEILRPKILDKRALVPTAATLTAFVTVIVIIAAMTGVLAPLSADTGGTITEPGATHPVSSTVPETYVADLRKEGISASGEILAFTVVDGQPFLVRGAEYPAFATVTDAQLVAGRAPERPDEAVIGQDLARTLGVGVGETLTLGGSTQPAVTRVEVVGIFAASGPYEGELVVPLPTARVLSGEPPGTVQFVRATRLPETEEGVEVVRLDVPGGVAANDTVAVRVTVQNTAVEPRARNVTVTLRDQTETRRVRLGPGERSAVTITLPTGAPGTAEVRVGALSERVRIGDRPGIVIEIPSPVPPNSSPLVRVVTRDGQPVENASVIVGNQTTRTDAEGRTRIDLDREDDVTVVAKAGGRTTDRMVQVTPEATRQLQVSLTVRPLRPDLRTRPQIAVRLWNPWNRTLGQRILMTAPGPGLTGNGTVIDRDLTLERGTSRTITARLPRRPPGVYEITARVNGEVSVRTEYRVLGDQRIAAAVASSRGAGSTGLSQAIETVVGNLRVVLAVLLGLAGLMTVGGTTAAFAQAVHARRHTVGIHRATGAEPRHVLGSVLLDALRIGAAAVGIAVLLATVAVGVLNQTGVLSVFGIRLVPEITPVLVVTVLIGPIVVTLLGAGLATLGLLATQPYSLLSTSRGNLPGTGSEDQSERTPADNDRQKP